MLKVLKVGDLVKECVPLMAGDVPERIGIITKVPDREGTRWYKVLIANEEELIHYNSLKKMET
jgi:hypothetical protein